MNRLDRRQALAWGAAAGLCSFRLPAAEPLAKELTKEVGRLTRDVLGALEGARKKVDERLQDDEEE